MREHGVGEVRAPDRLAGLAAGDQRGVVELEAELAQPAGHRLDPARAVAAEVLEGRDQVGVGDVELVAEDVQVLVAAVHGRELGGGGVAQAQLAGAGGRLGDAVDGVVVGQREQLHPRRGRALDDLRGRQRAVGVHGMGLQVE